MIDAERVTEVLLDSLFQPHEIVDGKPIIDPVIAHGITMKVGFHPKRLNAHRQEIKDWLMQLPDSFRESGGGGMSFLNMCVDRNDEQWTGMHRSCEELLMLGIATGMAATTPAELNSVLPGGVPYIIVKDTE